jgi:hypothetical protein
LKMSTRCNMSLRDLKVALLTIMLLLLSWCILTFIVVIIKILVVLGLATVVMGFYLLTKLVRSIFNGKEEEK